MPFIEKVRREIIDKHGLDGLSIIQPGDRCYVAYKNMVDQWKVYPRWATVHEIKKALVVTAHYSSIDDMIATYLAWEVFFQIHVMPYELKKRSENGDIL